MRTAEHGILHIVGATSGHCDEMFTRCLALEHLETIKALVSYGSSIESPATPCHYHPHFRDCTTEAQRG